MSEKRDARIAAARARDAALFQQGAEDAETIAFLASHTPERIQQVITHAVDVQSRPMAEGRAEAIQVLGAAAALAKARTRASADDVLMLHPRMEVFSSREVTGNVWEEGPCSQTQVLPSGSVEFV